MTHVRLLLIFPNEDDHLLTYMLPLYRHNDKLVLLKVVLTRAQLDKDRALFKIEFMHLPKLVVI